MLIRGAEMVLPDRITSGDVRLNDGKIETVAIGGGLALSGEEILVQAEGLHLLAGAIDPQVHFREPGNPEKETIGSGSRAAAAGGVTSFLDMPNNNPAATSLAAVQAKLDSAAKTAVTNYGFFIGATPTNITDLQDAVGTPEQPKSTDGICGIKVFMGSSTGDLLVHQQEHLDNIFANTGGIIATHCEDEDRLNSRWPEYSQRTDMAAHAEWRDRECAMLATERATALAKEHNHRLHVLHLTTGVEADWLAHNKGKLVTTEVCPQHLTFDQADVEKLGTRLKMNPPIRYTEDRETLWRRLRDGTIDCIATDHAPHTLKNKALGFPRAHSGMPGVETSLPLMLTHAMDGKCTVRDVARWMCEGPAEVYGMVGKGRIVEGGDADLTLVDLESRHTIRDSDTWTNVGWTPLAGMELTGFPQLTIVGGIPVHARNSVSTLGMTGGRSANNRATSLRGDPLCEPGKAGSNIQFS